MTLAPGRVCGTEGPGLSRKADYHHSQSTNGSVRTRRDHRGPRKNKQPRLVLNFQQQNESWRLLPASLSAGETLGYLSRTGLFFRHLSPVLLPSQRHQYKTRMSALVLIFPFDTYCKDQNTGLHRILMCQSNLAAVDAQGGITRQL